MEGDANLQEPQVKTENTNPIRSNIKESPFPAPSSSLKTSPDFLRNVQAAFKRRRPHNTSQLSSLMPRRIVLPQRETPNNADKNLFLKAKETISAFSVTQEDASITPPSILGTMTSTLEGICNQNPSTACKEGDAKIMSNVESRHVPPVEGIRKVHFVTESNATSRETEWETNNQANPATSMNNDGKQHTSQSVDMDRVLRTEGASSRFTVGRSAPQDQLDHLSNFLQRDATYPMTQSSVCATSISVHATSAPLANSTTICSSSRQEQTHEPRTQQPHPSTNISNYRVANSATNAAEASTSGIHAHCVKEIDHVPRGSEASKCTSVPNSDPTKQIEDAGKTSGMQPEGLPSRSSSSDVKPESSKIEKQTKSVTEKGSAPARKKNYDSDMFFKVNGKLYQRLGKIGSGGSSEVHKVISCDCKIYALKKIRLKGRDYATAYGFCQEILYLNKLKGKNNIIQLIDYEVTDKALLEEVMTDSLCNKDGRLKEDGYIYMVLEYGEIDLAHMLSQKWKDMEPSETTIDENWLRFYWQQILQAVNTIHEERIVHSDLKPANFLLVKGSLKLIDFGIAKAIMSDTTNIQRDAQVGTLSYMSPEAFMCNETDENGNVIKCGRPSDIWSLGCILYQMVYGRTPFAEFKTFWAKFKVITDPNHEITYAPLSNPWLLDLMKKCLAWDRNERWRIPQLLQHPFLVPPIPSHLPNEQDQDCRIIQLIAESHSSSKDVGALCFQLQRLLAASPESRDEQCKLLTRILDVGSRLREQIMK